MKKLITSLAAFFFLFLNIQAQSPKAPFNIDHILQLKRVGNIQLSPDEAWIAFTITTIDTSKDKSNTRIWMISTDGSTKIPMTSKEYSASRPRWSPDGKYLTFLASKGENAKTQVWKLNRLGGEAQQMTKIKQGVSSFDWSPNSDRLLLTLRDPKPSDLTKDKKDDKKPKPHVIDRIYFKRDYAGYLDRRRTHLYVFTPGDTSATQITSGDYDDSSPQWSPDGKSIVFVSNRSENPDLSYDSNIWIVDADNKDKGATMRQLTQSPLSDGSPSWSPDGKWICYITNSEGAKMPFATRHLAVIPSSGGTAKILTQSLDRNVINPAFSKDGKVIYFGIEDSGERQLASINPDGSNFQRLIKDKLTVRDFIVGKDALYTLNGYADKSPEIYQFKDNQLTQLSKVNEELLNGIDIPSYEKVKFNSKDGTPIEGFVVKPPNFDASKKHPLILWIHGGPIAQFTYDMGRTTPFLFAANGYVVLLVNPRGSSGYGEAFCNAIFADWGNKDYEDVIAGVDYLIDQGFVDADRLGVGGWSYGGILTNYVITQTERFKAAASGASLGLIRSNFGHDQYIKWYTAEFGTPWENQGLWERLSPFNKVEKITTPTLWMGGGSDWNVPIINSEQMYLGMKMLGRETQLIVYPGEHHGIRRPSFQRDRLERYLKWFDKYLK